MGLEVNTSLKKYIDDLVAAAVVACNAYTDAHTHARIKTGTYVGNGVDDRDIDIGIDLAAKDFPVVIIKGTGNGPCLWRTEYGQGDLGFYFTGTPDVANTIQAFTATGFQVGTNGMVNGNGITYRYCAMWEEP